jgi:hypothetical protein
MSFIEQLFGKRRETSSDVLNKFQYLKDNRQYTQAISVLDRAIELKAQETEISTWEANVVRKKRGFQPINVNLTVAQARTYIAVGRDDNQHFPFYKGYAELAVTVTANDIEHQSLITGLLQKAEGELSHCLRLGNTEFQGESKKNFFLNTSHPLALACDHLLRYEDELEEDTLHSIYLLMNGITSITVNPATYNGTNLFTLGYSHRI